LLFLAIISLLATILLSSTQGLVKLAINFCTDVVARVAAREMPPFRPAVAARDGQEEDLKELMERCWADLPDERPSFEAVRTVIRRLMK
jgi:hypothetical protein